MNGHPIESDWKRFRNMVSDVRERYPKEKNHELVDMLTASEKTPTERFWETFDRAKQEKRISQDCLDQHSGSNMFTSMLHTLRRRMLKKRDLERFGEEGLQGDLLALSN